MKEVKGALASLSRPVLVGVRIRFDENTAPIRRGANGLC